MLAWFRQIDDARTLGEVVAVARDYLARWSPQELASIPEPCRPGRLRDHRDLEELHARLVEEYRRDRLEGEARAAVQRLTSFCVRASVRIAQLSGGAGPSDDPPGGTTRRAGEAKRE